MTHNKSVTKLLVYGSEKSDDDKPIKALIRLSEKINLDFKRTLTLPPFQVLVEIMQSPLFKENPNNMKILINF